MKIDKDASLQEARREWLLMEIKKMKLANPVTELAARLGYGKSVVSEVLNGKSAVSIKFFRTFCEKFGYKSEAINHIIINNLKNDIEKDVNLRKETFVNKDAGNSKVGKLQDPHLQTKIDEENLLMQIELAKQLHIKDAQIATKDTHIDRLLTIIEKISGVDIETDKSVKNRQAKSA